MTDRVAIFIDGGYLIRVLKDSFDNANIDYSKLSNLLAGEDRILRTYYYNCLPYKKDNPNDSELKKYEKAQRFINALEQLDHFEVRLGKLEFRGWSQDKKPIYTQKRVDILLGCDLVVLSTKNKISKAIIITGDSDFIPAIEIAKNEGVEIELVYDKAHKPHESLIRISDVRRLITQEDIDSVLLF